MMHFKQGRPRNQLVLFDECLEEVVGKNNPVRVIDAYVEKLDLRKLGFTIPELATGASPYRPQLLLKVYLYGYLERIRTSRRLEKECGRNKEMMWLAEGLAPDFKTIADFRRDNREGLKNIFKEFLHFCHKLKLLALETVAIDGTKLRAQNNGNNIYKRAEMVGVRERIEQKIAEYLEQLDVNDRDDEELRLGGNEIERVVALLKDKRDKIKAIEELFAQDKDLQTYFATDPDSRFQSDKGQVRAGYNAQIAGDAANKLIVAAEVTNDSNDLEQMTSMVAAVAAAKEQLGITGATDAALDAGYHSEEAVLENKDHATIHIVVSDSKEEARKRQDLSGAKSQPAAGTGFAVRDFTYDKEQDVYRCPEGKLLSQRLNQAWKETSGRAVLVYQGYDCQGCKSRVVCTSNKVGRTIKVSVHKEQMDAFRKEMASDKNMRLRAQRKAIIEHPFGTIKRTWGYGYFLQKGLDKVRAEFRFICFAYNFKRVLSLCGMEKMMAALA